MDAPQKYAFPPPAASYDTPRYETPRFDLGSNPHENKHDFVFVSHESQFVQPRAAPIMCCAPNTHPCGNSSCSSRHHGDDPNARCKPVPAHNHHTTHGQPCVMGALPVLPTCADLSEGRCPKAVDRHDCIMNRCMGLCDIAEKLWNEREIEPKSEHGPNPPMSYYLKMRNGASGAHACASSSQHKGGHSSASSSSAAAMSDDADATGGDSSSAASECGDADLRFHSSAWGPPALEEKFATEKQSTEFAARHPPSNTEFFPPSSFPPLKFHTFPENQRDDSGMLSPRASNDMTHHIHHAPPGTGSGLRSLSAFSPRAPSYSNGSGMGRAGGAPPHMSLPPPPPPVYSSNSSSRDPHHDMKYGSNEPLSLSGNHQRVGHSSGAQNTNWEYWSVDQVCAWLTSFGGLGAQAATYVKHFRENVVDGPMLKFLEKDDLTTLGVRLGLHRAKIFSEIEKLKRSSSGGASAPICAPVVNPMPMIDDLDFGLGLGASANGPNGSPAPSVASAASSSLFGVHTNGVSASHAAPALLNSSNLAQHTQSQSPDQISPLGSALPPQVPQPGRIGLKAEPNATGRSPILQQQQQTDGGAAAEGSGNASDSGASSSRLFADAEIYDDGAADTASDASSSIEGVPFGNGASGRRRRRRRPLTLGQRGRNQTIGATRANVGSSSAVSSINGAQTSAFGNIMPLEGRNNPAPRPHPRLAATSAVRANEGRRAGVNPGLPPLPLPLPAVPPALPRSSASVPSSSNNNGGSLSSSSSPSVSLPPPPVLASLPPPLSVGMGASLEKKSPIVLNGSDSDIWSDGSVR